jgi:NhaP-type Na+/H+ or K+/H+ antiporter
MDPPGESEVPHHVLEHLARDTERAQLSIATARANHVVVLTYSAVLFGFALYLGIRHEYGFAAALAVVALMTLARWDVRHVLRANRNPYGAAHDAEPLARFRAWRIRRLWRVILLDGLAWLGLALLLPLYRGGAVQPRSELAAALVAGVYVVPLFIVDLVHIWRRRRANR